MKSDPSSSLKRRVVGFMKSMLCRQHKGSRVFAVALSVLALLLVSVEPREARSEVLLPDLPQPVVTPVALQPHEGSDAASTPIALSTGDLVSVKFYGREDLSNSYRIDERGVLQIPTIGNFEAADHSAGAVQEAVRVQAEKIMQRPAFVTISVIERQPVFVTGHVAKPGSFTFTNGMAVIHAVALAGGTPNRDTANQFAAEALREAARLQVAKSELQATLVRQAELEAVLAGNDKLEIPAALIEAVGRQKAQTLISVAQGVFERGHILEVRNKSALEVSVQESETEIEAYRKELANISKQREVREAVLIKVKDMSERGLTTMQRLTDSQILLSALDRDAQAAIANIARAKQVLERSQRDLDNLSSERKLAAGKELSANLKEIWKLNAQIAGSGQVISHLTNLPADVFMQERDPELSYQILRRSTDGKLATIDAIETTTIHPGDVIRVKVMRR